MNCHIINVGTELLTGSILNTNSQYLSKELSDLGFSVHHISTVGDNAERLEQILSNALKTDDIILVTGGLGPTEDDLTKEVVSKYLGRELILDEAEYERLQNWFKTRGIEFTPNNIKQAYLPKDAFKIPNPNGTAPGVYFDLNDKHIFLLPGPPGELRELYKKTVKDILIGLSPEKVVSRYYNTTGLGESLVEDRLFDIIDNQDNPTIATYAGLGEILIRMTANGANAEELLDEKEKVLKERIGEYIFTDSKDSLVTTIGNYLIDHHLTIATAESCTGGMISELLTNIPGISSSFLLGVVTYANEAKCKVLNVSKETLDNYGAVSEETCLEMCENVRKLLNTDIGVSTTGIAGPDGGTPDKPVGLVYTGIATKEKTIIKKNLFKGSRDTIRRRTCNMIFQMIKNEIMK